MSRTGVGCRVMIDGALLDDGCIDWGAPPPGTELRRNLARTPTPTAASGEWSIAYGIVESGGWATSIAPAVPNTTSYIFATRADAAFTAGQVVSLRINYLVPALDTGGATHLRFNAHRRTGNVYYPSPTLVPIAPNVGTEQTVTVTVTLPTDVPVGDLEISVVTANSAAGFATPGPGFTMKVRRPVYEHGPTVGTFFDGDTLTANGIDYQWVGAQNNSASIAVVADYTYPRVGQGVSADEGLSIAWGRSTTVEQPKASTCTFTVVDDPGGVTVLQSFNVGARVDVFADATVSGGGVGVSAFDDPTFSTELRATTNNATATRTTVNPDDPGGWAAAIGALDADGASWVRFPPGQLQAPGTNPAAWAHLPATSGGQTWTVTVKVRIPSGMSVRLRPVYYSGPYADAATVGTASTTVAGTGTAYQTASVTFSPGTNAQWIGFQLDLTGGITWEGIGPSADWAGAGTTAWGDLGTVYVDTVQVLPPGGGTTATVQVFAGRITDLSGFFDEAAGAPALAVTATDFMGDLGNRYVGDQPWPVQTVTERVTNVLALAAIPGEAGVAVDVAPTLGPVPLTAMDVDRRAASGLLTDVAQSVDGVLWSSAHPVIGPYMRLEDPAQRLALYQLALSGGLIVIVPYDFTGVENAPPSLSACDILRDPVDFVLSAADVATRVSLTWQEQALPDTIERNLSVIDPSREVTYGTRAVSIQTDLTTAVDGQKVADQIIARLGASWRIEGLVFSDADVDVPDAAAATSLLILLNGVTRGGQALLLTDLDYWSPLGDTAPVYLEGGSYSFTGGGWALSLNVSRATGVGRSVLWNEIPNDPAWVWDAWDPAITWNDLRGVARPS